MHAIQSHYRLVLSPPPFSYSLEDGKRKCSVVLFGVILSTATGSSNELAKKSAARLALEKIKEYGFPPCSHV